MVETVAMDESDDNSLAESIQANLPPTETTTTNDDEDSSSNRQEDELVDEGEYDLILEPRVGSKDDEENDSLNGCNFIGESDDEDEFILPPPTYNRWVSREKHKKST